MVGNDLGERESHPGPRRPESRLALFLFSVSLAACLRSLFSTG